MNEMSAKECAGRLQYNLVRGCGAFDPAAIRAATEIACQVERGELVKAVHARWIINSDGYYPYCSNCHVEPKGGNMTDYCPSCGSRMDANTGNHITGKDDEKG
jgi:Zn finger protein HypA/HybF involved in hydrogenase expression